MSGNKVVKFQKPKKSDEFSIKRGFALYSEGACFDGQNKDKLALEKYLLAEKAGYETSDLYASISRIYNVFEDYEKAKQYAQKAIDIDEEYDYPYYLLGGAYYEQGNYDSSLKNYLLAEKFGLDYSVVMYRDISDVYNKVEPENIIKQLEYATKAIKLDPEDSYSYYWKGWIYFKHDEYKQARKYYEKAEQMGYYSFSFYYEISYIYTMVGDLKKALAYANKCIFIDKDDSLGYYRKGWAYYNVGNYDKAKPLFITAENKKCEYADMYTSLGYIYQLENNFEKAKAYCEKAIKYDKKDPDGFSQLGNIYAALKSDYKTAIKYYKKAYKVGVSFNEFFYLNYGMLYYMLNRNCMALKILNQGLEKYPNDYNLRASVIAVLQVKKEYDKAYGLTQELIKLEPKNEWNDYNLALCYYNRKVKDRDYDRVISLLESMKNDEILVNGGCYAVLSFSYYQKKNYEKSKEYYVKFFATSCVEEFIIKNKKELKRYYKKLLKKFPDDKDLAAIADKRPEFKEEK